MSLLSPSQNQGLESCLHVKPRPLTSLGRVLSLLILALLPFIQININWNRNGTRVSPSQWVPQHLTHGFSTLAPALNHYSKLSNSKKERPKIADSLLVKARELKAILGALFPSLMKWIQFYTYRLILVILQQRCSRTTLTTRILQYPEAEAQVCLDPKENLGRTQRSRQMNSGENPRGGTKIKVHHLSSDSDQHMQLRQGADISTLTKQGNYFLMLQSFLHLFKGTATWQ